MAYHQEKLLNFLMEDNEITWQSIILDLVKNGEIDPWDIDLSILTQRYLDAVKQMQTANLYISGKVILASAILLKLKSEKLLTEGIGTLDNLMFPPDDLEDESDFVKERQKILLEKEPKLTIKTPQARKRKVSVDDLIEALEKALEVNERKILKRAQKNYIPDIQLPEKKIKIGNLIKNVYSQIREFFSRKQQLYFHELVPSGRKEDIIYTMLPILHLATQEKIDLNQHEHFGPIDIRLHKKQKDL